MNRVELARSLHDAISRVRGVSRLGGGSGVMEVSTQYAYGRVAGVSVAGARVEAQVVVTELPVVAVAERVHKAAARVLRASGDDRPVRVVVTDVDIDSLADAGRR